MNRTTSAALLFAVWLTVGAAASSAAEPRPTDRSGHLFDLNNRAARAAERFDYAGEWRLLLPSGVEHTVVLRGLGEGEYELEPAALAMSGRYAVKHTRFVSVDEDGRLRGEKVYVWRVRTPYMLVLERESDPAADYTAAVLFRKRPEDAGRKPEPPKLPR